MSQPKEKPKGLLQLLEITDKRLEDIEHIIMYSVFHSYINTAPQEPVDTSIISEVILQQFHDNERTAAAYVFGAIEQELKTGENFDLLEDIKLFVYATHRTMSITQEQFNTVCKEVTNYYIETGRVIEN